MERRGPALAVACLYFLSGLTGLVYEVTFSKYLSYVFGATAYASSAVLVAFMGGLSAGAVLVARWDARIERRFFFYGAAEILVGCFCAVSPWLFAAIGDVYVRSRERSRVVPRARCRALSDRDAGGVRTRGGNGCDAAAACAAP